MFVKERKNIMKKQNFVDVFMKKIASLDIQVFTAICFGIIAIICVSMTIGYSYAVRDDTYSETSVEVTPIDISETQKAEVKEKPKKKVKETTQPIYIYYDVPLSHDFQDHIFDLCVDYSIDPAIIIAMIERESNYKSTTIGDNGHSFGLMQIQPQWHQARMNRLGCQDLLDPYQNVWVGIDILGELLGKGKSLEWALMAYNGGPSYANNRIKTGNLSDYCINILIRKNELNAEKGQDIVKN